MFSTGAMAQAAYKPEYKMSLVLGPPTPWGQAGKIWADLVKERTQGRINIKLYPGVSLIQGDQTREFSALRQGVIDMAVGSTINWSPQVKQLNLFSHALPDARLRGRRRADAGRGRQGDVQDARQGRRGAAGLGRERLPRDHQLEAGDQVAGRPQGHEDPRGGLAACTPTCSPRWAPTPRR